MGSSEWSLRYLLFPSSLSAKNAPSGHLAESLLQEDHSLGKQKEPFVGIRRDRVERAFIRRPNVVTFVRVGFRLARSHDHSPPKRHDLNPSMFFHFV